MIAPPASRNAPCPCGSGKRYKECHGAAANAQLAHAPADADALRKLAGELFEREDYAASAEAYGHLLATRPELPAAFWVRRGIAQQKSGQLAAAETSFREAAARAPDDPEVHTNIGTMCVEQGRYADADAPLSRALALDAENAYALALLIHARQRCCAWEGIDVLFKRLAKLLDGDPDAGGWGVAPFPLLSMPLSPQTHLKAARSWARGLAPAQPAPRPPLKPAPGERLRVGFVSSDFRVHPVAFLMMEVWERIDRSRIEAFAYGILPTDTGPVGERIARAFEHFADVSRESTATIAQRIRGDRIAILFDLNGYTTHARSEIFALRPAPLQINSIGFPGTLGAEWYDYIHVDPFVAPPAMKPHFTERFFAMPHACFPSDTTRAGKTSPPPRSALGLPERGFVFACFNNTYKILPDVFAIWMRMLAAVPQSVLWLYDSDPDAKANLRREAQRAGVAAERLIFAPWAPPDRHLARAATADLFLDTYPYSAGATANDALLAGLPVVSCAGETLASRLAGSQLHAIGLPELVTASLADYESLALGLARHPAELAALRTRLAANRRTHPLFDMARYTRDLEDGLLRIWRDHTARAVPS